MPSLLFGISPMDPVAYVAAHGVICAAAALASYVPARRAATSSTGLFQFASWAVSNFPAAGPLLKPMKNNIAQLTKNRLCAKGS